MKKSTHFLASLVLAGLALPAISGCAGKNNITVWVGEESVDFYQKVCNEYIAEHTDFGYGIEVKGVDAGSIAGTISSDASSCADIYTVAHDNIGKLVNKNCAKPITNETLVGQVEKDNPSGFQDVIHFDYNEQNYLFAVPYISQALFLYYNTDKVSEEQVKTFEGLQEAAEANNCYAVDVTGTDGFNFSFTILARKAEDNSTTLKLYEGGKKSNCWFQGDDEIASLRWAQRYFGDQKTGHGGHFADKDWPTDLQNEKALAVVGGAWHYNAAKASLGSKLGVTVLPTYTLTAEDVDGLTDGIVSAGTKMQGGTFSDCKVFMINSYSAAEKYVKIQELLTFLSSKDIQNRSFLEAMNVPAYSGADEYVESVKDQLDQGVYQMAKAQIKMADYGIAQPFISGTLNTYYYSSKGPDNYKDVILKTGGRGADLYHLRGELYSIQNIWQHGEPIAEANWPAVLPATIE